MKNVILKNNKGQGMLEYIILTSLIGIFCMVAMKNMGSTMKSKIEQIDQKINRVISIGR